MQLIQRFGPLCQQGDIQYLAPPDERHFIEEVYREVIDGKRYEIRVFYNCSGGPVLWAHMAEMYRTEPYYGALYSHP